MYILLLIYNLYKTYDKIVYSIFLEKDVHITVPKDRVGTAFKHYFQKGVLPSSYSTTT